MLRCIFLDLGIHICQFINLLIQQSNTTTVMPTIQKKQIITQVGRRHSVRHVLNV